MHDACLTGLIGELVMPLNCVIVCALDIANQSLSGQYWGESNRGAGSGTAHPSNGASTDPHTGRSSGTRVCTRVQ
jgi:hypothetical protein